MPAPDVHDPTRPPSPRPRRDRGGLLAAVGEVLARDGFGALGVNAVARAQRCRQVLIYRCFDGLPASSPAWVRSGSFWPGIDELMGPDRRVLRCRWPSAARFFERSTAAPAAADLEIMAAEIVEAQR